MGEAGGQGLVSLPNQPTNLSKGALFHIKNNIKLFGVKLMGLSLKEEDRIRVPRHYYLQQQS